MKITIEYEATVCRGLGFGLLFGDIYDYPYTGNGLGFYIVVPLCKRVIGIAVGNKTRVEKNLTINETEGK